MRRHGEHRQLACVALYQSTEPFANFRLLLLTSGQLGTKLIAKQRALENHDQTARECVVYALQLGRQASKTFWVSYAEELPALASTRITRAHGSIRRTIAPVSNRLQFFFQVRFANQTRARSSGEFRERANSSFAADQEGISGSLGPKSMPQERQIQNGKTKRLISVDVGRRKRESEIFISFKVAAQRSTGK